MRSLLGALLRGGCDDDEDVVSMGGSREGRQYARSCG